MAERCRRQLDQSRGETDGGLRAETEVTRRIRQPTHLLGGCAHDAFLPVTDVDAPQTRECIQQLIAVTVAQKGAAPALEHRHAFALMLTKVRERMNQVFSIQSDQ